MSAAGGVTGDGVATERDQVVERRGSGVVGMLARLPDAHRRTVAAHLGLAPDASPEALGAAVCDRERLASAVGGLSDPALRLIAAPALLDLGTVQQSWSGRPSTAAAELERHGLAFAFQRSYLLEHWIAPELRPLVADVVAAPYARRLLPARPARWIEAPLQLAHDGAALWAYLARSPVRVKADGIIYQRDVPKLFDALPQLELHGPHDLMEGPRLTFVLALLRDERLVRVRVDDRPGATGRRELVVTGDPLALLSAPPERLRARLLDHVRRWRLGGPAVALVNAMTPGSTATLESFGAALRALCEDVHVGLPHSSDAGLGLAGLHFVWLSGAVAVGLGRRGLPAGVRAQPAAIPDPAAGRIICQPNFELVALAPPTPAQRLLLGLVCEPVRGQEHVFRLTRASVRGAQQSGVLDGGVAVALERLVGELPQNVVRSLADWTSSVRRALRLRTAMLIDAGDEATAERLLAGELGGYVVERLGPAQLAIRVADVKAVEEALRREGHPLEPDVERVSGPLPDRGPARTEAELSWEPAVAHGPPEGRLVSTVAQADGGRPQGGSAGAARPPSAARAA